MFHSRCNIGVTEGQTPPRMKKESDFFFVVVVFFHQTS